jgi:TRAP-type uncharacterized transport system substrate-binding protein
VVSAAPQALATLRSRAGNCPNSGHSDTQYCAAAQDWCAWRNRARVDADVVYEITRAIFLGLDRLKEASPLFNSLSREQMASDGMSAPLHEGAARYYAEAGLR